MAAKKKPLSVKQAVRADIKLAQCWCSTALSDVNRHDRLDAIDSMRLAAQALGRAQRVLRSTFPAQRPS